MIARLGPTLALELLAGVLVCGTVHAEDLGVKGQLYQPDPDAREEFKDVIRAKQASGELARFWDTYRDRTVQAVKHPAPLGVRSDYGQRTEIKPVRFVVGTDYRDQNGHVVARRGTVVEPLKIQPLTSGLVFIDGRDQAQVDYAIRRGRDQSLKIVLTAGSPYDLRVRYRHAAWRTGEGIPFYFDQRKIIIDTLAQLYGIEISSVPVVLTQAGSGLRLEFGLGERQ